MENLQNIIESVVYVSGTSISIKDIAEKLEVSEKEILQAAKKLQEKYSSPCGLQLLIFNNKLQFCSNPDYAEQVASVLNPIRERELSRSMLETAAIIAYKQPVTRIDLEELRGNSEYAIQNLLKLGVIEIVGRKDAVGRPVLFGTTDEFLKRFQISSLDELPDYDEMIAKIQQQNSTDSYLYKKSVYVENGENNAENSEGKTEETNSENVSESNVKPAILNTIPNEEHEDDVELGDLTEEDLPDFLKGEDIEIIG